MGNECYAVIDEAVNFKFLPMPRFKVLLKAQALSMGYSADRRRRRAAHRDNARYLATQGGSIAAEVRMWHLWQARHLR